MPIGLSGGGGIPGVTVSGTPAAGQVIDATSATAASWAYPPGFEVDYVQKTSNTTVTATSEATATTIVTGNAITYDGSTVVVIEFYCASFSVAASTDAVIELYDGASSAGFFGELNNGTTGAIAIPSYCRFRLTPSAAAHTYSIRGWKAAGTGAVIAQAGAGSSGVYMPCYIRQTRV